MRPEQTPEEAALPGNKTRRAWLETPENPEAGWRVVEVVREDALRPTVDDGAGPVEVDASRLSDYDATFEDEALCADLSNLASLDAAPLVLGLGRRFRRGLIYTRVGPVLMAVNPNTPLPAAAGPHVTDVALVARRGAVEANASQAVVISGESGAGKTVSATKIIEFLIGRSSRETSRKSFERRELAKEELLSRLKASIPALEALGNAATALNENSSRFGKLVKLTYDGPGGARDVVAAHVEEFLLEKARVSRRARGAGERNYHFLCQVAAKHGVGATYAPASTLCAADAPALAATDQSFRDLGVPWDDLKLLSTVGEAAPRRVDVDDRAGPRRASGPPRNRLRTAATSPRLRAAATSPRLRTAAKSPPDRRDSSRPGPPRPRPADLAAPPSRRDLAATTRLRRARAATPRPRREASAARAGATPDRARAGDARAAATRA